LAQQLQVQNLPAVDQLVDQQHGGVAALLQHHLYLIVLNRSPT
jgi:hypothetical protein